MPRNRVPDPTTRAFAALLSHHLREGTRPAGQGERWTNAAFAQAIGTRQRQDARRVANPGVADTTVSAWRLGKSLPAEIEPILRALFGPMRDDGGQARQELRAAYVAARSRRDSATLTHGQSPARTTFVAQVEGLAIYPTPISDDAEADPQAGAEHREMQRTVRKEPNETTRPLFVDCIVDAWDPKAPTLRVTLSYASEMERLDAIGDLPPLLVRLHLAEVDLRLDLRNLAFEKGSVHSSEKASFGRGWTVRLPRQPNGPVLDHLDLVRLLPRAAERTIELLVTAQPINVEPELVRPNDEALTVKDARVIERILAKWGCSDSDPELELDRIRSTVPGRAR